LQKLNIDLSGTHALKYHAPAAAAYVKVFRVKNDILYILAVPSRVSGNHIQSNP